MGKNFYKIIKRNITNFSLLILQFFKILTTNDDKNNNTLKYRFIHGTKWIIIGSAFFNFCILISNILAARILGVEQYGELGIIQSTIGMLSIVAGLGIGVTATKYIAEYKTIDKEKTGNIISLSIIITIISGFILAVSLLFLSPFIASSLLNKQELTTPLQISSGILFFGAVNGAQIGALIGFEAFKKYTITNIIVGFFIIPITIIFITLFGLIGAIVSNIGYIFIGLLINGWFLRHEYHKFGIRINFRKGLRESSIIWKFSVPAIMASLIVSIATWLAYLLLVNQQNGFFEMGLYNAANQWRSVLLFIPGIIGQVSLPLLSEQYGYRRHTKINQFLKQNIILIAVVSIPIALLFSLLSNLLMSQYGNSFNEGSLTLIIILITATFLAIETPIGTIITASGRMWLGFYLNVAWAFVLIIASWFLVSYGAIGLALAFLISYIIHGIWSILIAKKILNIKDED